MPIKKVGKKWEVNGTEYDTEDAANSAYKSYSAKKMGIKDKIKSVANNAAKSIAEKIPPAKRDYISDSPEAGRFGSTYTRYGGVISVLKKGATPETKKKALEQQKAKKAKK